MRKLHAWCVGMVVLLMPAAVFAQASITGVVRDTSGGVLPGVTVEAASPGLIEKVRTTVTDGSGQYRLVDLRSGMYDVTFSLPGFNAVKREAIELAGSFTATVNADMRVGALEETVVVTGESPVVDVQSVRRQTTIDNQTISEIPGTRAYAALMQLMPNTVTQVGTATDTQVAPGMVVFGGAGGRTNEGRLQVDGLSVGSAFNGAGVSAYIADVGNAAEITMTTSGGLGEAETGGPSLNILPKEGGNRFAGSFYAAGVTKGMIGSNYTPELQAAGLTTPGRYREVWDFNLGIGGPIAKDRVWFYGTFRDEGSDRTVPGMFANANAGDPTKWTYVADTTRPAVVAASYRNTALRLTLQASARHKFGIFWDDQKPCEGGAASSFSGEACRKSGGNEVFAGSPAPPTPSAASFLAPETAAYRDYGQRVRQAKWTAPVSSNLLLEGGIGGYRSRYGGKPIPGAGTQDLIRVVEQCAPATGAPIAGCPNNGNIPNLTYRSGNWTSNINQSVNWRASASYVLGSKSFKVGYQGAHLTDSRKSFTNNAALQYRVNSGWTATNPQGLPVPNQVTMTIDQFGIEQRVRSDAFYGQGAWTISRMTVQGALRYDRAWSYFPAQSVGGVRFFPGTVNYPETKGVTGYNDLTPRGGVAFDVFGNGKTSLKFNVGRYLEAAQNGGLFTTNNPTGRISTTASRSWNDVDRDFVVDCDLLNPLANSTGGDTCGANTNTAFGSPVFDTTQDPALFSGWGIRSGDWQIGAAIQQEVLPRVSVEFGYERRWLLNFISTDNLARSATDHTSFGITAPSDSRLPGGGGNVISGLFNVTPTAATVVPNNFVTLSSNYADRTQMTNSFNMNVRARTRNGITVQGGFNSAKTHNDTCALRALLPESAPTNPWCDTTTSWVTRFTALGSYIVPKVDVLVSATFRSDQGGDLAANWTAPNSATVGLDRPFAGVAGTTIVVNLIEPGTLYGDRVNEFNMRLAKILRFGRTRTNVGFDVSNVTNSAAVLTYNQTFIPGVTTGSAAWLRPTSILQPRFVKISAQVDF